MLARAAYGLSRTGPAARPTAVYLCALRRALPAVNTRAFASTHFALKSPRSDKNPRDWIRFEVHTKRPEGAQGNPRVNKSSPGGGPNMPDWRTVAFWAFTTAFLASFLFTTVGGGPSMTWQQFRNQYLDQGLVERIVVVNKTRGEAVLKPGSAVPAVQFSIGSVDSFDRNFDEAMEQNHVPDGQRVPVSYVNKTSLGSLVVGLLPTLLLIGGFWWLMRRSMSGAGANNIFKIGKSTARKFNEEKDIKIKFADVAGCDEAKAEIMEFVNFLKDPKKYESLGARVPRGAILSGPPGTGKTLLARATAGEAGVPFYSVSGSEFVEMFVGVGASRVRDLFATARSEAPSIVFIDEIDAIGRARAPGGQFTGGGHDEREATLNQVLVEMDGFSSDDHVVVLAGTNRPDVLDKALLRPGRFSRHITVDKPDVNGRHDIYLVYLRKVRTNLELDELAQKLAALTPGFAGADIANCVNEAALIAARNESDSIEWTHFEQAVERTSFGLEKKSKVLLPDERRTIAFHEAGHAICGWFLKRTDPLVKVTIIPRGSSLGYAKYLPSDIPLPNNEELFECMVMALGGRVSEELNFNSISSGASSDYQKVTQIATNMVVQWGMSPKIGWVNYDEPEGYYTKPFSQETAAKIDAEVQRIVNEAHTRCRKLLTEKAKEVKTIAEALLAKETLDRADFVRLIGERPWKETSVEFKYLQGKGLLGDGEKTDKPAADNDDA